MASRSFSIMMLLTFLQMSNCACGMDLQLIQTHAECGYPTGILSLASEKFLVSEDHVSLRNAAQCLAQSAVHFHGMECATDSGNALALNSG
jgi:hypothetical protein